MPDACNPTSRPRAQSLLPFPRAARLPPQIVAGRWVRAGSGGKRTVACYRAVLFTEAFGFAPPNKNQGPGYIPAYVKCKTEWGITVLFSGDWYSTCKWDRNKAFDVNPVRSPAKMHHCCLPCTSANLALSGRRRQPDSH